MSSSSNKAVNVVLINFKVDVDPDEPGFTDLIH